MTGAVDVTEDLAEWARRAGYEVNQGAQALCCMTMWRTMAER